MVEYVLPAVQQHQTVGSLGKFAAYGGNVGVVRFEDTVAGVAQPTVDNGQHRSVAIVARRAAAIDDNPVVGVAYTCVANNIGTR